MKPWYQYRIEEMGIDEEGLQVAFIGCWVLAYRLRRFLFLKAHFGGILWQFSGGWTDWKGVYGSAEEFYGPSVKEVMQW